LAFDSFIAVSNAGNFIVTQLSWFVSRNLFYPITITLLRNHATYLIQYASNVTQSRNLYCESTQPSMCKYKTFVAQSRNIFCEITKPILPNMQAMLLNLATFIAKHVTFDAQIQNLCCEITQHMLRNNETFVAQHLTHQDSFYRVSSF
jgi:hypothetical protein